MIPAQFEYHRPQGIDDALAILAEYGDDARILAGGHSLIPLMKVRMADVPHLIDLQQITSLKKIVIEGCSVTIGSMVTQHEIINSSAIKEVAPILQEASLQIADPQVREMGTLGGNVANGDPANDLPGLMQCLNARYTLVGPSGERTVAARDYYEAAYFTERMDDEILTSVNFVSEKCGYAYEKQKRKIGDYATAACAVVLKNNGGVCDHASIAMTNLASTPIWSKTASQALNGSLMGDEAIRNAVIAAKNDISPVADNKGPVDFKMHVAGVIIEKAIRSAWKRA